MKQFLSSNWYKLMIGSSLLMGSFGFMMYSITSVLANESKVPVYKNILRFGSCL